MSEPTARGGKLWLFQMATQTWLRDEVAKLRKELAAACAELHRLGAIDRQRDPDATLN